MIRRNWAHWGWFIELSRPRWLEEGFLISTFQNRALPLGDTDCMHKTERAIVTKILGFFASFGFYGCLLILVFIVQLLACPVLMMVAVWWQQYLSVYPIPCSTQLLVQPTSHKEKERKPTSKLDVKASVRCDEVNLKAGGGHQIDCIKIYASSDQNDTNIGSVSDQEHIG